MEQITVFSIVYNNYGKFIPQWNEYMNNQTIPVKKFIVLGHNHGADMQYLKENNIDYIYYDSNVMGVLRNKGLERVKTNWWFYFAIDDELLPHACEEIVNTEADAISIRFNAIDVNGELLKDQKSPHLQSLYDVKNWQNAKWGGYTAVRGNTDLRYNEDVEVPNLTFHFELFRRGLEVVESKSILVVHHRWADSHHFKSARDGSRRKSISVIDKIAQELVKEKEEEMENKRYIVEANKNWEKEKLKCSDFNPKRIPKQGEQWEIDGKRLDILLGNNPYKMPFVKVIEEIKLATGGIVEGLMFNVKEEVVTEHQDWRVSPPLEDQIKETTKEPIKKSTTKKQSKKNN